VFVDNAVTKHECKLCKRRFQCAGTLTNHVHYMHSGDEPHKCTTCGKGFGEHNSLKRHLLSVHNGGKPHVCTTCGKRFEQRCDLGRHLLVVHHGVMQNVYTFSADVCSSLLPLDMKTNDLCSPFANPLHDSLMEPSVYPHCSSSAEHQLVNPAKIVDYFSQPIIIEPSPMQTIADQPVYCTLCKSLHSSNEALALHVKLDHSCEYGIFLVPKQPQNVIAGFSSSPSDLASSHHCSLQSVRMRSTAELLLSSIQSPAPG